MARHWVTKRPPGPPGWPNQNLLILSYRRGITRSRGDISEDCFDAPGRPNVEREAAWEVSWVGRRVAAPDVEQSTVERLAVVARALADPVRLRMLSLMAQGRACCGLPPVSEMPVPGTGDTEGIAVQEFQARYNLSQSMVSYHLRVLRQAGLVIEHARGKWTFYTINKAAFRQLVALIEEHLKLDG